MELAQLRTQIDEIDRALVSLFCRRQAVSKEIAIFKQTNNLPVRIPQREAQKLNDVADQAGEYDADYVRVLYAVLFSLSRSCQEATLSHLSKNDTELNEAISLPDLVEDARAALARLSDNYKE